MSIYYKKLKNTYLIFLTQLIKIDSLTNNFYCVNQIP